jgi:gamma-glutamylcyclotransferase (GGCT)/AIG2-like uncharacterized protein YtfP
MKSDTAPELVFVYGTLRRGGSNAFRMDGAEFVGPATVGGVLYRISWYPGLVLDGEDRVFGEVYQVGPELLRALDEFEGLAAGEIEGSEYRRVRVEAVQSGHPAEKRVEVWIYEWTGPVEGKNRIKSGDWLDAELPRNDPWFTLLALACLLGYPGVGVAAMFLNNDHEGFMLSIMGMTPLFAWSAAQMGEQRREVWRSFRKSVSRYSVLLGSLMILLFVDVFLSWLNWV